MNSDLPPPPQVSLIVDATNATYFTDSPRTNIIKYTMPKTYDACQAILENDRSILVTGRLDVDEDRVRITADQIVPLEDLRERRAEAVQLRLVAAELDDDVVARLREAVAAHRGDVPLYLEVVRPGSFRLVARAEPSLRVAPSRALQEALEAVVGTGAVRYRARSAR